MSAITIARQLGSLGDEVAQAVAERLNYRVMCRELINQAAARAGAPDMALAVIDDLNLLGLRPSVSSRRAYHQAVKTLFEELAAEGQVIIIGRAGQVVLRDRPEVLHVKVIAPVTLRAERIARQHNISIAAAQAQVEASDRHRRNYLRRYYHSRWDDPELYDLIVNTARLTPGEAACLICQAMAQCLTVVPSNAIKQP
jgi:CMP/dCMP kinase